MKRMLSVIKMKPFLVGNLQAEPWGAQHQAGGNAVFAVLMNYGDKLSERGDAVPFLLSLRATGYAGDIVLGMSAGYKDGFLDVVKEARCVVYTVPTECNDEVCNYVGRPDVRASVNMVRFFLYQYWTSFYEEQVRVAGTMTTDVTPSVVTLPPCVHGAPPPAASPVSHCSDPAVFANGDGLQRRGVSVRPLHLPTEAMAAPGRPVGGLPRSVPQQGAAHPPTPTLFPAPCCHALLSVRWCAGDQPVSVQRRLDPQLLRRGRTPTHRHPHRVLLWRHVGHPRRHAGVHVPRGAADGPQGD